MGPRRFMELNDKAEGLCRAFPGFARWFCGYPKISPFVIFLKELMGHFDRLVLSSAALRSVADDHDLHVRKRADNSEPTSRPVISRSVMISAGYAS